MSTLFDSLFRWSSEITERGLIGMDSTLRSVQAALDPKAGTRGRQDAAPLSGPGDTDGAASDFANRVLRSLLASPRDPATWARLPRDVARSVRQTLLRQGLGEQPRLDPVSLAARTARVPLSFGTLAIQEALRALHTAQSVPVRHLPEFTAFVTEIFSDLHVYFSLQYREELERLRRRVKQAPRNARTRLELGRTYIKCGLFKQAARELEIAAKDRSVRQQARYEKMIAEYRMGRYDQAMRDGVTSLDLDPADDSARYWLFLSSHKAGGYNAEVPGKLRMEVRAGHAPTRVDLDEVAARIGLDKTAGGRGTAIFDFDGDGHLDVVIAGAHAGCSLFHNNGDGTFEDVSTGSGLDACVYGFGVAAGDTDNNGRQDLFVSSLGFFDGQGRLYRNHGDGIFTDVTEDAGVGCWGPGFSANWVDYDGDGFLDLFVIYNLGGFFDRKTPNRLFKNNGDGTFKDVTDEAGLRTMWPTLGSCWGDFTNSGRQDLFVSNMGRSQLFRNNGDGTFTDISREAGVDAPGICSGALCCDIDNDGWLDIVQFTYSRPKDAIHTLRTGEGPADGSPLRVYKNNRDGSFKLVSREMGLTGCWGTMSGNAGDFNNDGHQDLFLGNGDPSMDRSEASVLLQNNGRRFTNVTFSAGLPYTGKGHGVNMADLAGDGRLHLIVAAGGLYPGDLQTTTVFRPRERPGNYLNVRLVGTTSNRDAIGARIKLTSSSATQYRQVSGGSGFGCLPCEQHFGLAGDASVDSLEVRWPAGMIQHFSALPANARITITEGNDIPERR